MKTALAEGWRADLHFRGGWDESRQWTAKRRGRKEKSQFPSGRGGGEGNGNRLILL